MSTAANENTLRTALDAIAARAPSHDTPNGGKVIILPDGYKAEYVDPAKPVHITSSVTLHDRDSLIAYVNRFKGPGTRIFAEPGFLAGGAAKIVAAIDYHEPWIPDFAGHSATYVPRYSDQWVRWHAACKTTMKQAEFAEFIEEVRADIVDPDAAKLLDIVRTFKASKRVEFDSVVYQPNGDVMLAYDERTQQQGKSGTLPETMMLGIPVYFRGAPYKVPVLVRYKVGGGAVAFQLKMDRSDIIEDAAFGEMTKAVGEATSIDCYLGRR